MARLRVLKTSGKGKKSEELIEKDKILLAGTGFEGCAGCLGRGKLIRNEDGTYEMECVRVGPKPFRVRKESAQICDGTRPIVNLAELVAKMSHKKPVEYDQCPCGAS